MACFGTSTIAWLRGYYSTLHVIVLLAHMALCRIKTVEQLQYEHPGELGKLLGLDRVPEVRCLRHKLAALSIDDGPQRWAGLLSRDWLRPSRNWPVRCMSTGMFASTMAARPIYPNAMSPDSDCACAGPPTTGSTTSWASRSSWSNGRSIRGCWRLCERHRATPAQGSPQPADRCRTQGRPLSCTLRDRVRPRRVQPGVLQGDVADPPHRLHQLPQISQGRMAGHEFAEVETTLPGGERVTLKLAERGTWIGDRKSGLWVRETRKLTDSGHQVSLISTAFGESRGRIRRDVQSMVPGKLLPLHDATLCH